MIKATPAPTHYHYVCGKCGKEVFQRIRANEEPPTCCRRFAGQGGTLMAYKGQTTINVTK